MAVKSTPEKRNTYKDAEGNLIPGMTVPEVLDKPVTILAKREYTWGRYKGMAVKVQGEGDKLAIVEITAETPIKALCGHDMPKSPYLAMFVEKTSKNGHDYYTVIPLDSEGNPIKPEEENGVLPF